MASSILNDPEFGDIQVSRSHRCKNVSLKIDSTGEIKISMPPLCPLMFAKKLISQSRPQLRHKLRSIKPRAILAHGDKIGVIHTLHIEHSFTPSSRITKETIKVFLPHNTPTDSPAAQKFIRQAVLKSLRFQSKKFLSTHLKSLANNHGFYYERIRFSNASSRWGSCSTTGTISLNIWLMQLPHELVEYVLIHELCHTIHHNHSKEFWLEVGKIIPDYRTRRQLLRGYQPSI